MALWWKLFWSTLLKMKISEYDSKMFTYGKLFCIKCAGRHLLLLNIIVVSSWAALVLSTERKQQFFWKPEALFFHEGHVVIENVLLKSYNIFSCRGYNR